MIESNDTWALNSRLENDTFPVCEDELRAVLLLNDIRWPWIIIVPKILGAEELSDMDSDRIAQEMQFTSTVGKQLKAHTACEKINIAAIGNMVRQLHIHVIARSPDDTNWPGPVWGHGVAEKYTDAQGQALAAQLSQEISERRI